MKKVLLLDDEKYVLKMLEEMIDWEFYGFCIVGCAENVKDAMQIYYNKSPDIIITDISMQGLNGIDFITRIRLQDARTRILILSAYDKFEYAQKAVKLGVDGYLLKPIQKDELLNNLIEISKKQEQTIEPGDEVKELQNSLENLKQKYLNDQLIRLYQGEKQKVVEEFPEQTVWAIISIRCIVRGDIAFFERDARIYKALDPVLLFVDDNKFVLFLRCTERNMQELKEAVNQLVARYAKEEKDMLLGVAYAYCTKELEDACNKAESLRNSLFYEKNVYWKNDNSYYTVCKGNSFQLDSEKLLLNIINGNTEAVQSYIQDYIRQSAKENIKEKELKKALTGCFGKVAEHFRPDERSQIERLQADIEEATRSNEIETCINGYMDILQQEDMKVSNSEILINRAVRYIKENCYDENFSIEMVANYLNVSKSYLAKVFKNELGESVWNYVIRIRISKAKELLVQTEATNYEIAKNIGYVSEYHFSRAFSKVVGVSPSVYKKTYKRTT